MKRRDLLSTGGMAAVAWALGCHNKEPKTPSTGLRPPQCEPTSSDMEGPFYPPSLPLKNGLYQNVGQRIVLSGIIQTSACIPLETGFIHLWHADQNGDYDLKNGVRNYTGQQAIIDGKYNFETLMPGAYANGPNRFRPRHLHFKIQSNNQVLLTTQLYFAGDEYLRFEPHLPEERIVQLKSNQDGDLVGEFNFIVAV